MKNLHLILVLFSIASMFTSFGVYDVDATKDENNGNANGCENGNGKVKEKNPHCNETSSSESCSNPTLDDDLDGIPDCEDYCLDFKNIHWIRNNPDHDGDKTIDLRDSSPCG